MSYVFLTYLIYVLSHKILDLGVGSSRVFIKVPFPEILFSLDAK